MQFAKSPRPGKVKTRLLSAVSPEQACQIHVDLLQHCCRHLLASELAPVELWVDAEPDHPAFQYCCDAGARGPKIQCGTTLGQRMYHALEDGLRRYQRVLLVGSDCPAIDRDYLLGAIDGLARVPLVIGPAADGGYVLLGATRIDATLFADIDWGQSTVYRDTLRRADRLDWRHQSLGMLRDIDRPEDLAYWQGLQNKG